MTRFNAGTVFLPEAKILVHLDSSFALDFLSFLPPTLPFSLSLHFPNSKIL